MAPQQASSTFIQQATLIPPPGCLHASLVQSGIPSASAGFSDIPAIWLAGSSMDTDSDTSFQMLPGVPEPSSHYPPSQSSFPSMTVQLPRILPAPSPTFVVDSADHRPTTCKEKRHGCQLCNKKFDRPSTLKKHLLVHTGEKAWACEVCGRRFGVSSNLNRHVRRCKEKWQRNNSLTAVAGVSSSQSPETISSTHAPASPRASSPESVVADCSTSTVAYSSSRNPEHSADVISPRRSYKRSRRPPSPARKWVPNSLLAFDLTPVSKVASTPLPPAVPSMYEERNSYDKANDNPYHRTYWQGRLVGPSYSATHVVRGYGKLLVF